MALIYNCEWNIIVFNKNKAKILIIIVLIAGAILTIINMVLFQSSISKTEISNDTKRQND